MEKNTLFSRLILYTSIESIVYQVLLCTHQIMLFQVADSTLYGQAGALFSAIFLLALYFNVGLDASLAALFKQTTQNKANFIQLFWKQFFLTIRLAPIACIGIYFFFPEYTQNNCLGIIFICSLLIIIESAKKTLRTMLHLALLQKSVAFVEIATLFLYIVGVWTWRYCAGTLDLFIIFTPMIVTSLLTLIVYFRLAYIFYTELSDATVSAISWKPIRDMRIKNWIYQILHSLFSSNFLVLSVAKLYGFELAALLKVMSFCVHSINYILQHIFRILSCTLFAHAINATPEEKQHIFAHIKNRLSYALLICPIIFIGYHVYLYVMHPDLCIGQIHIISLFMILLFSENIAVAHEQYFIVEGRTGFLIACNSVLLIPCIIAQKSICDASPIALLYMLLVIRLGNFLLLHYTDTFLKFCEQVLQKKYRLLFAGK